MGWRTWLWKPDAGRRLDRLVRRRPWEGRVPAGAAAAFGLKGMLGRQESLLFFHLARDVFTGRGTIVDAGSFLGKSASLFAAGLRDNRIAPAGSRRVHCFDDFRVHEEGTVRYLAEEFGRTVEVGDSFRDLFERQIAPCRNMLEVHAGDFLEARWSGGPIEILMVDIAKSPELWAKVLSELFPRLVPGVSLVVQQDYHFDRSPMVPEGMEFLAPEIELVVPRVDWSAVFRVREEIPAAKLDRAVRQDFAIDERRRLLRAAVGRIPSGERGNFVLEDLVFRIEDGEPTDLIRRDFDQLARLPGCEAAREPDAFDLILKQGLQRFRDRGWDALRSGDWAKAMRIGEALVAERPDCGAFLILGAGLNGLGRHREAEEALRQAPPDATQVGAHLPVELAIALRHQGRGDEAERALVESLARPELDPAAFLRHLDVLHQVFAARGDAARDRQTVDALRRMRPGDPRLDRLG